MHTALCLHANILWHVEGVTLRFVIVLPFVCLAGKPIILYLACRMFEGKKLYDILTGFNSSLVIIRKHVLSFSKP